MPDRIVSIDIETTGMHPESGDKIIEIGAIEMIDLNVTGNDFHQYINPNFPISESLRSMVFRGTQWLEQPDLLIHQYQICVCSQLIQSKPPHPFLLAEI